MYPGWQYITVGGCVNVASQIAWYSCINPGRTLRQLLVSIIPVPSPCTAVTLQARGDGAERGEGSQPAGRQAGPPTNSEQKVVQKKFRLRRARSESSRSGRRRRRRKRRRRNNVMPRHDKLLRDMEVSLEELGTGLVIVHVWIAPICPA